MHIVIVYTMYSLINSYSSAWDNNPSDAVLSAPKLMTFHCGTVAKKRDALTLAHLSRVARPTGTVEGLLAGPAGPAISARIYVAQLQKANKTCALVL